jgi:plant 4alpha-monomethylsterol monooxygenase
MAGIPAVERAWTALVTAVPDRHLKVAGTFLVHELAYWAAFVPFLLFDAVPALARYKLQPKRPMTRAALAHCAATVLRTHIFLVAPIVAATHPLLDLMGTTSDPARLPPLQTVFAQLAFFFVLEDALFYFGHRALHTPYLYRKVHSVHHTHSAPFGVAAEYAHPAEVLFLGASTIVPPLLVGPHLFTLFCYLALRAFQTVECHSGYDLPWSPNKWIPGYGGARFHDHHHRIHSGNLSSTFVWMDWLAGTDAAYRDWERKQARNEAASAAAAARSVD